MGRIIFTASQLLLAMLIVGCSPLPSNQPPPTVTVIQTVEATRPSLAKTPSPAPLEPLIKISVADLALEYEKNAVAADVKYRGKLIELEGTIGEFGRDLSGNSYIILLGRRSVPPITVGNYVVAPTPFIGEVRVTFVGSYYDAILAQLQRGVSIQFVGRCKGKLLNTIMVEVTPG
jgi:hypothetical protein